MDAHRAGSPSGKQQRQGHLGARRPCQLKQTAAWGSDRSQDPHPSLRGSGLSSGLVSESEASAGK